MTEVEEKLCEFAYKIANENIDILDDGCKCSNPDKIKKDPQLAAWFVTECMVWGFTDNINHLIKYRLFYDENEYYLVINANGTPIRIDFLDHKTRYEIAPAKRTTITIDIWA